MPAYRLTGLPHEPFAALFDLPDAELRAIDARRVIASAKPGFPCRVSLEDAEVGEKLLLLPYEHHAASSPYRASGPIYVRRNARRRVLAPGDLPEYVTRRLISVRAYGGDGLMIGAAVCEGSKLAVELDARFAEPQVACVHLHNAGPGCFSCRAERC